MINNNTSGIKYILRHRKILFLAILIGGILGLGLAILTPKKYLSTAIIYPYNSHSVENIVSNPQFGFEVETEQLMQLLESKSMRNRTIEHFKLYDYYEIDTTVLGWKSELAKQYIADVKFFRSKYLSIVINVTTKVPELSADIANFQVSEINKFRASIFEQNRLMKFNHVKEVYFNKVKELEELKSNIYALKPNSKDLIYNYMENRDKENYDSRTFIDQPELEVLMDKFIYVNNEVKSSRYQFDRMKELLNEPLPSVYAVDIAEPTYKKDSPSYLLNTLTGALVFLILVLTLRLSLDKWIEFKEGTVN